MIFFKSKLFGFQLESNESEHTYNTVLAFSRLDRTLDQLESLLYFMNVHINLNFAEFKRILLPLPK